MIHYHGTPIGGKRIDVVDFLRGRDALVPFSRPEDMPIAMEVCRSVIVDNGAFTIWKQGGTLDPLEYFNFICEWYQHPAFAWCLIPDSIGGTEEQNDDLIVGWRIMRGRLNIPSVPVWHYHESLERLERLSAEWPIVALGSSGEWPNPGVGTWWDRTREAMSVVCDDRGRPRCKLHGLRMLSSKILNRLPLHSADSTNCARNGDRTYRAPTRVQRMAVNAHRIESVQSRPEFRFPPKQLSLDMVE